DGYARYAVKRAPYPAIVPSPGEQVRGLFIGEIGPAELACLDDFEGELYRREPVTVTTDDGDEFEAYAYVLRRRFRASLADAPWDEQDFAARWHDPYVRACRAGGEPG
ncbi:MAG: gamma-glutamylcyclotransferase family protein, partial [Halofilum sp. (in: g-proteobacteria)]